MSNPEQLVASIKRSAQTIVDRAGERDPEGLRRRDQHAKHHGCVWGYLDVLPSLPRHLQAGIFVSGARYRAWVRFSNSSSRPQEDTKVDGRAAAIKVLLEDAAQLGERPAMQDFILLNHSAFFARDLQEMESIFRWLAKDRALPLYFLRHPGLRGAWAIWKLAARPRNVLELTYHSQLPSAFGGPGVAVKYRLRPVGGFEPTQPTKAEMASGDHLRHVLRRQLRPDAHDRANARDGREPDQALPPHDEVRFAFEVQFKGPKDEIDVANVSWKGRFEQVAVLRIPRQDFEHADRMSFAEDMAFNPWNGLREHEPLGELSGARQAVYKHISEYRRGKNQRAAPEYTLAQWHALRALPPTPPCADVEHADLPLVYKRWFDKLLALRS